MKVSGFLGLLLLCGCGGGGGEDGGGGSGGAGGAGGAGGSPFEGELPALATLSESDCQSFLPLTTEGVWRYTAKGIEDAAVGAETTIARGEDENDYVRETIAVFDILLGDGTKRIRQVVRETYTVEPSMGGVGPRVLFKSLNIEERELGTQKFVRTLERRFLPAYPLLSDAWHTGQFDNTFTSADTRLVETSQRAGEEEAEEESYLVPELRVQVGLEEKILLIDGRYREHVREVEVFDDVTSQLARKYWVQQGVGVVQWQYRDSGNLEFVLKATNLEPSAARHPACPSPAGG